MRGPGSSPTISTKMQALVGRSLSEAVLSLALDERALRYTDEPPGKLKMISVSPEPGMEIEIHLRYDSALLFSEDQAWPLSRIGAAKVIGFVERRGRERRVFGEIHTALSGP